MANGFLAKGIAEGLQSNKMPLTRAAIKRENVKRKAQKDLFERATTQIQEVDKRKNEIVKIAQNIVANGDKVPKRLERVYDRMNKMGNFMRKRVGMPADPGTFRAQLAGVLTPAEKGRNEGIQTASQDVARSQAIRETTGQPEFITFEQNGQLFRRNTLTGETTSLGSKDSAFVVFDPENPKNARLVFGQNEVRKAQDQGLRGVPASTFEFQTGEDAQSLFPGGEDFFGDLANSREQTLRTLKSTDRLFDMAANMDMKTGTVGDIIQGIGAIRDQVGQVADIISRREPRTYSINGETISSPEQFRTKLKANPEQFFDGIDVSNTNQAMFASHIIDLAVDLVRQKQERISNQDVKNAIIRITGGNDIATLTQDRNALLGSIAAVDEQARSTFSTKIENAFELQRINEEQFNRLQIGTSDKRLLDVEKMSAEDLVKMPNDVLLRLSREQKQIVRDKIRKLVQENQ